MTDGQNWNLIGKKSPKEPQMFYPINDSSMTITKGDILAARCTMVKFFQRKSPENPSKICNFRSIHMNMMCTLDKLTRMKCVTFMLCIGLWARNQCTKEFVSVKDLHFGPGKLMHNCKISPMKQRLLYPKQNQCFTYLKRRPRKQQNISESILSC